MNVHTEEQPEYWKNQWSAFWSGWILLVIGVFWIVFSQLAALTVLAILSVIESQSNLSGPQIQTLMGDGDVVGLGFLIGLPLIVATLFPVVKIRRKQSFVQYVGLRLVPMRVLIRWVVYMAIFGAVAIVGDKVFDRPLVYEWMLEAYESTDHLWLLFIAVGLLGPVAEELLYRGYILRVWSQSKLGSVGSVALVSLIWAGTHLQYDWYDMGLVLCLGVLLGISRLKTGSIIPAIAMHISWNTAFMVNMGIIIST